MSRRAVLPAGVRFVRRDDVVEAEVDGEIIALNADTAECFGLNAVGSRIWRLLARPLTATEIRDALLAEYEVEATACEQAVRRLLAELCAGGLVEPVDG